MARKNKSQKQLIYKILYWVRDYILFREILSAVKRYCHGNVLDVGGWDFYLTAKGKEVNFKKWTTLEYSRDKTIDIKDKDFSLIIGDGCNMVFGDNSFDTVINIQVLEHVFDPVKMVYEISRVLKSNGCGIFVIPQNSTIHLAPSHYCSFTRFWIQEVMKRAKLEILELKPLGGTWSSIASRLVYFFLQSIRYEGMSTAECKRSIGFYFLFPFMALYAVVSIPISMLFSIGDLVEEPNNHLVVVVKR